MPNVAHLSLRTLGRNIFEAVGVPPDQSAIVTDHLVDSNLFGHDSHGMMHTPGYVRGLRNGGIVPVGDLTFVRDAPASGVIDAQQGFGIVVARRAMEMAVDRAKEHTLGAIAVHQASHIGRLGEYACLAAEKDCVGIVMLNGGSRSTAPFGGTSRRLPPNPIAVAVPRHGGHPLMLDITTSMAAMGKAAVRRARGQDLPVGWFVDAHGGAVTDANAAWSPDVAMLPMGGPVGYKGYGLAVMIDAIAGGLSWAGCSTASPTRGGSGFLCLAIKIESFIDLDEYKDEIAILSDWVMSSKTLPGVDRIYLPGEIEWETREKREAEGIPIEEETWERLHATARECGASIPDKMLVS